MLSVFLALCIDNQRSTCSKSEKQHAARYKSILVRYGYRSSFVAIHRALVWGAAVCG
jgi:hypothetical protein